MENERFKAMIKSTKHLCILHWLHQHRFTLSYALTQPHLFGLMSSFLKRRFTQKFEIRLRMLSTRHATSCNIKRSKRWSTNNNRQDYGLSLFPHGYWVLSAEKVADFHEKVGRISEFLVPSVLKTVPVSREFTVTDLFRLGDFVPYGRGPSSRISWYFWTSMRCSGAVSLLVSEDILRASLRHEYFSTLCLSLTAASISKLRQFLESLEACKQMSYPLWRNQWEISGKLCVNFRLPGISTQPNNKTVSHNEETTTRNEEMTLWGNRIT